jgi:hypothetical protein
MKSILSSNSKTDTLKKIDVSVIDNLYLAILSINKFMFYNFEGRGSRKCQPGDGDRRGGEQSEKDRVQKEENYLRSLDKKKVLYFFTAFN